MDERKYKGSDGWEAFDDEEISSLDFKEPELHPFDASSIFVSEAKKEEPKKLFGKRSAKRAVVTIRDDVFEEPKEEIVEEIKEEPEAESQEEAAVQAQAAPEEAQELQAEEPELDLEADAGSFTGPVEIDVAKEEEEDQEPEEEEEDADEYYSDDEQEMFEDKKHFLLSQYPIIEDYLNEQSRAGYHFVRHVGRKYYFVQSKPKPYYYSIEYFKDEPSAQQWRQWESQGWKLVSKAPAKKRKEAGWYIFRNLEQEGEYRWEIDNDEEKYRFFKKYANSCRSTMFLVFICMAICLVTGFLQYQFQGYLAGIAVCGVLFLICLIVFLQYGRMLRHAKKRTRMLQAKLRIKESQEKKIKASQYDTSESEADLDSDWDTLTQ